MSELEYKRAYCCVIENNPTRKFYERTGAKFLGQTKIDEIDGQRHNEVAYEWDSLNNFIQY